MSNQAFKLITYNDIVVEALAANPSALLALQNPDGSYVKIRISNLLAGQTSSYEWDSNHTYGLNELSEYAGNWWKSKITGNQGNIPQEDGNWTQVSPADESAVKLFQANKVYKSDVVVVMYNLALYSLKIGAGRPYSAASFISADWDSVQAAGTLTQVLSAGNDAGAHEIVNLANGASAQSAATVNQVNAAQAAAQSYADGLVLSAWRYCGSWDPTGANVYPTTGGTGTSGAIKSGNAFEISVAGAGFDIGDIIIAKVDVPGQTVSNWGTSEHNTQQATTTTRGTAMIVDTTTIQNASTTDDAKMVTSVKFWQGISTLKGQANTWALAQTFSTAPVFSSASASQYLKTNASKQLVSVSSLPDSDFTYGVQNSNLVFAGPASGSAASPTYRSLVTSDITTSMITYAKIQNVANARLLGNASGSAAAPSEITVGNGLTLASGTMSLGGTLSAATTLTSNAANQWLFDGTWTASANNQYHFKMAPTITSRVASANDMVMGGMLNPTFNINSTGIDAVGFLIDATYNMTGGLTTSGIGQVSTTATGMTITTYTSVSASSTTGSGTGALFTIIVNTATSISSVTVTTAGSGYKPGDQIVFNASLFGGSGTITYGISAVTSQTLGANASVSRLINRIGETQGTTKRYIDFVRADGTTSFGSINMIFSGGTANISINDAAGSMLTSNGTTINSTRNFSTTANVTATNIVANGTTTMSSLTTNGSTNLGAGGPQTGSTLKSTSSNTFFGINSFASRFLSQGTTVVGLINTFGTITGGSLYTNGTYNGISLTGGSGSGATANITVSGGAVTAVTKVNPGTGYKPTDSLSATAASVGGTGSGFSIPVSTVDYTGTNDIGFQYANTVTDPTSPINYVGFYGNATINLTGNTNQGFVAALYWNPTLTNVTSNYGIIIAQSAARNGFGTSSPTATVHIVSPASSSIPTVKLVGTGTSTNKALSILQSDASTSILSLSDNGDFSLGLSGSKLGFFGVTAIAKVTTAITAATFVANSSGISNDTATWGGYTAGQIVAALKNYGLLT